MSISNHNLVLSDVPDENGDWLDIDIFALTFDGYKYHGTFTKCAEIANEHRDNTLTDLRTCLFFEQRRWRHFDESPDEDAIQYIRGLVQKIRDKIANGERQ
jgi:hypothetical protein